MDSFSISSEPIDNRALRAALENSHSGASVVFEGWVRNHNNGKKVLKLEYTSYETLATKEGARIIAEAIERFDIDTARAVHRIGELEIGHIAVWVGTSAAHRGNAFDACRYIIDEIKDRVPIWKREHYPESPTEWVNCHTET